MKRYEDRAAILGYNMDPFMAACIESLSWVDGIYYYDDGSTDKSIDTAKKHAKAPLVVEVNKSNIRAFEKGELEIRNYVIDRAFASLNCEALIIIDVDELVSSDLKKVMESEFADPDIDSIMFSTWHLYSEEEYFHIWETTENGVAMVDPHTRVIKKGKYFTKLFENGSHPILQSTEATKCFHRPYHFHLKYFSKSKYPNYSMFFLSEKLTESEVKPYLRKLPFSLPQDILNALSFVKWEGMKERITTPHHEIKRKKFSDPQDALIHPKNLDI